MRFILVLKFFAKLVFGALAGNPNLWGFWGGAPLVVVWGEWGVWGVVCLALPPAATERASSRFALQVEA